MKLSLTKTIALSALALIIGATVAAPARADWDDHYRENRGGYERHEEHERHEYFEHHYRPEYYGYYQPVYVQPRVVYAPRPVYVEREPAPLFNFLFDVR